MVLDQRRHSSAGMDLQATSRPSAASQAEESAHAPAHRRPPNEPIEMRETSTDWASEQHVEYSPHYPLAGCARTTYPQSTKKAMSLANLRLHQARPRIQPTCPPSSARRPPPVRAIAIDVVAACTCTCFHHSLIACYTRLVSIQARLPTPMPCLARWAGAPCPSPRWPCLLWEG